MSLPKNIIDKNPYLLKDTILVAYRGSIVHGTYQPNKEENSIDDKDVMAIVLPDIKYYFGLKEWGSRGTKEICAGITEPKSEWDIVSYDIKKFIYLLSKGNPNVLYMLWLNDEYFIKRTEIGQKIIDNKDLFVSKSVYHSFRGYSRGQKKRMMIREEYHGWMGDKRKKLVDKYGFDCKMASHAIRLSRMGIEFLNEGELHVLREDAKQLLEIKTGQWSLEEVQKEINYLDKKLDNAYDNCKLPNKPDYKKINNFCVGLLKEYFIKKQ